VTATERSRLLAYEGDEYELVRGHGESPGEPIRRVFFFKPKPGVFVATHRPWSPAGWRLVNKACSRKALASARQDA
jgi:hypothetical protein